jgi:hypothetical protein
MVQKRKLSAIVLGVQSSQGEKKKAPNTTLFTTRLQSVSITNLENAHATFKTTLNRSEIRNVLLTESRHNTYIYIYAYMHTHIYLRAGKTLPNREHKSESSQLLSAVCCLSQTLCIQRYSDAYMAH